MKKEFYIGYVGKVDAATQIRLRLFVGLSFLFLLVAAMAFVFNQAPAKESRFDFAEASLITGTYFEAPYPFLHVEEKGQPAKDIILLGFGKNSAHDFLPNQDLDGKKLSISGNLIYYNERSLIQVNDSNEVQVLEDIPAVDLGVFYEGPVALRGEIVDPKCYFGVMKPGFGKIHRSCAALCIWGGIPPVLLVDNEGTEEYYLITSKNGGPLHSEIIPYIAQSVRLKGELSRKGTWNYLAIDLDEIEILSTESKIYGQD